MPQVLVRDLRPETITRLKARARRNGRSLTTELREILELASLQDLVEARALALAMQQKLAGREHSDSSDLLAEDRPR